MRSVLRTAVIVLAVMGVFAFLTAIGNIGRSSTPQIVYVQTPAPAPA